MNHLQAAARAMSAGRLDEAETLCQQVLLGSPAEPTALLMLGEIALGKKNAADAERLASLALTSAPKHPDLLTLRGQALFVLGQKQQAIECLIKSTELRLVNPVANQLLSNLLAERRDPTPRFTVSIITSAIRSPHLQQAIDSIQAQTYPFVEHFIVVDGPEHADFVRDCLPRHPRHPIYTLVLPFNIGSDGYCGHRAYGAAPYLVNGRFIAFLDADNWFDPDHVASLMAKITAEGLEWAYALRKIVDAAGQLITTDDCESLGQWPIWDKPEMHLVDVNCYMLRRDLAVLTSPLWYRRFRDEEGNPDFALCQRLLRDYPRCDTNGRYTVNYRAGMTGDSTVAHWFLQGNAAMLQRTGQPFPWRDPKVPN